MRFQPGCCWCLGATTCTLLSDSFTRADGTTIGNAWVEAEGDWSLASGQVIVFDENARLIHAVTGITANYIVHGDVRGDLGNDQIGLLFGYQDADNYFAVVLTVNSTADYCGTVTILQVSNGSETELDAIEMLGLASAQMHNIKVCVLEGDDPNEVILRVYITAHNGKTLERHVTATAPNLGSKAGFLTQTLASGGAGRFDNMLVEKHYLSDNTCPNCTRSCDIYYRSDHHPTFYFVPDDLTCEWVTSGLVSIASGRMVMTGNARANLKRPHPDGDEPMVVEALVSATQIGQRIRIYANIELGDSSPYGELLFGDPAGIVGALPRLSVSNGSVIRYRDDLEIYAGSAYRVRLCSTGDVLVFSLLYGTDSGWTISVATTALNGPYAGIQNLGSGIATVKAFSVERRTDPETGEDCAPCWEPCTVCLNGESHSMYLVTITGLKGSPYPITIPTSPYAAPDLCDFSFANGSYTHYMSACIGCDCVGNHPEWGACQRCYEYIYGSSSTAYERDVWIHFQFEQYTDPGPGIEYYAMAVYIIVQSRFALDTFPGHRCQAFVGIAKKTFRKADYPNGIDCTDIDLYLPDISWSDNPAGISGALDGDGNVMCQTTPPCDDAASFGKTWGHPHDANYIFGGLQVRVQSI